MQVAGHQMLSITEQAMTRCWATGSFPSRGGGRKATDWNPVNQTRSFLQRSAGRKGRRGQAGVAGGCELLGRPGWPGWPGKALQRRMFGYRLEWGEAGSHVRMGGRAFRREGEQERGPEMGTALLESGQRGS